MERDRGLGTPLRVVDGGDARPGLDSCLRALRAYLKRATAAHAAERWGLSAFRFVQRCGLGASCPRKPPASPA